MVEGAEGARASAPMLRVALQVFASMAAGAAAYLAALWLMGAPEIASFTQALRQRRAAKSAQTADVS